jgi:hypothetical protein
MLFRHISKIPRIVGIRPISAGLVVLMPQAQSRIVIQLDWHPMEQKLQKVFDLLAFGEPMIAQVVPLASKIPLFLARVGSLYKGLPL